MLLNELFQKIPFPIGIWEIRNEKIFQTDKNYETIDQILKDGMSIKDIPNKMVIEFIKNKKRVDIIKKNYITIYEFINENFFYEFNITKTNLEYILSSISYKIRNPLTNIIGLLPLLKKKQDDNSYLNIVKESSGNIVNVANNIIDILNIYQKSEYNSTDIELNTIIKECVNCFNVIAIKKKNKIVFKEIKPMIISTDKEKFVQIMMNLIDNSCKFTENGVIQVSIKNKVVKISDTGIGINAEKQKIINKIIDTQIEDLNFEESKGKVTGLGLLICKYICKELGIKINYKSQDGLGTVFYLDITELV